MSVYVVDARRTAIGTAHGMWRDTDTTGLAAPVLAALARACPESGLIRQIVLGTVRGPGGNVARVAALAAGLDGTPALSVDRQCGSGLAAVEVGHHWLTAEPGYVIAGGVQAVSTEPLTYWPPAGGGPAQRYERAPFSPPGWPDPEMGEAADALAAERGIGRQRQDAYAVDSHRRALAAQEAGLFTAEILPISGRDRDERPRSGFSIERLARFRPIFRSDGTVTAANSCGINDGAAAVLMADEDTWARHRSPGLRILALCSATCDPARPGWGIVPACRLALERSGIAPDQLDVIEFNEAFAGQVLACLDALGIDQGRNCPQGGAIALGHPWAASGAILLTRLFSQLVRQGRGRYGLAAIAIGGGQGTAVVVETARWTAARQRPGQRPARAATAPAGQQPAHRADRRARAVGGAAPLTSVRMGR
ncbi:thiolase family protein [Propionibacterium acidifaciens]|uniref:thiolase family protein n=2 Tax=Propionibacterium acidifaciens TaxID=556499 RepID=UPI0028DD0A24|nr:thiolase family protein [Propionibacterium acidifaciens]